MSNNTYIDKIFHLTSDGKVRSAVDAINILDCLKWGLTEKPAEIPMVIQSVDCQARAVRLGQIRTSKEIYQLYPNILTPVEFFAFGAKFPEEQCEAPHFTVWPDANGLFYCAIFNVSGDQRFVHVYQEHPNSLWSGRCRVLVREPALRLLAA